MKRRILAAVIGLGVLSMAGSAMAAGSQVVNVSASVPAKCAVDTGVLTAAFGDITLSPAAIIVTPSIRCTKGTTALITDDGGTHAGTPGSFGYLNAGAADNIKYTYADPIPGLGLGWGAGQWITGTAITITLDQAQANLAAVGAYTDTLTFTINP